MTTSYIVMTAENPEEGNGALGNGNNGRRKVAWKEAGVICIRP